MDSLTVGNCLFSEKETHEPERSEKISVEGLELCYSIGKAQGRTDGFEVSVASALECESVFIYGTKERAEEFFELIKRNTVTPCTLCDVFEDVFS